MSVVVGLCAFLSAVLSVSPGMPEAPRRDGHVVVAARGCRPACGIAIPADPAPSVSYAAEELSRHVRMLTGVTLEVVRGEPDRTKSPSWISIELTGDPGLGEDGFEIKSTSGGVTVRGGRRGVIYGVHELLERFGGVVWPSPDYTHVPRCDAFSVPYPFSLREKPAFHGRYLDTFKDNDPFAVRSRLNALTHDARHGGSTLLFDKVLIKSHTFWRMVPVSKYYDTHPEYFSLVKGKRLKVQPQLCLTNPDVFDIVLSNVLARISANKASEDPKVRQTRYYGVSQNDWNNFCECENCAVIDAREESHSGCVIWFVNKVAEAVEKKHPDVMIQTLAYMYGRKPPKHLKPRHNVMIILCTIECDFWEPMASSRYRENVDFRSNLLKWRDISDNLYVWDYAANWRATPAPFPNLRAYPENIRFFHESGVRYLYEAGIPNVAASFTDLKGWLGAKLMWNPSLPTEPLLKRFCEAYYGKGAPYVLEFIRLMNAQELDETKTQIRYAVTLERLPFKKEFYRQGRELWVKAEAAVADEPDPVRRHVAWGRFGVEYALAGLYAQGDEWSPAMLSRHKLESIDRAEYGRMRESARYCQRMLQETPDAIVSSRLNDFRMKRWLQALAESELPAEAPSKALLEDWTFNYDAFRRGRTIYRVRHKSAINKHAISVKGEPDNRCITCQVGQVARLDKGVRYRMRVRARRDVKAVDDAKPALFEMLLYDRVTRKLEFTFRAIPSKVGPKYEWYDMGEWTEKGHATTLYVNPLGSTFSFDCVEVSVAAP